MKKTYIYSEGKFLVTMLVTKRIGYFYLKEKEMG